MGRPIRCRRCGMLFTPEPFGVVAWWSCLCPRFRGSMSLIGWVDTSKRLLSMETMSCEETT
jgi:hypothetical protein